MTRICLIEDDPIMGQSLCDRFVLEGYRVDWCRSLAEGRQALQTHAYSVAVTDSKLPDGEGEALFREVARPGAPPFLFITAFASVERAVDLLKEGAEDYIVKPFDLDELVEKVRTLSASYPERALDGETGPVLGVSPVMKRVEERIAKLARAQCLDVLIVGESGVGKEHAARLLHVLGPGGDQRPFIAVNCGAFTETLLEAEIFGHERGAYTGATQARPGVFERAHGGTLFLDEIGDMSPTMQVKLLRVIQEREVVRLGGDNPIPVEVVVVSATHRDLRTMVAEGTFREDLYYRINPVQVRVPPLRERPEDTVYFAEQLLASVNDAMGASPKRLSPEARRALMRHQWPGNLRELKNVIQGACALAEGETLCPGDLFEQETDAAEPSGTGTREQALGSYLAECERDFIAKALEGQGGRIRETARALGISRKALWEKMRRLGIPGRRQPREGEET